MTAALGSEPCADPQVVFNCPDESGQAWLSLLIGPLSDPLNTVFAAE